ncbi:hypothetical protein IAD21_03289 [Abditibacteriota bacterium]|nr:hypothetical protein IAD21_03289 [Abditibacteriota bacterium]
MNNESGGRWVAQYPPIYYSRLREAARHWWIWFGTISTLTLFAWASLIWDWLKPLMPFAPWLGAIWIYSVIVAFASRRDSAIARVIPYFPKKAPHVEADTFMDGLAIARSFQTLESWSRERGTIPLSTFGWNDDLSGEVVVWHEAAQGVESITALLENPELSPEVREDLMRLCAALQYAQKVGTPFCLLLRHGDTASGAEMDARQGTFGWLSTPRESSNCQP